MLMLFKVADKSMEPTFKTGDYILVNRLAYVFGKPSKGDVIVLKHPEEEQLLLKRVSLATRGKCFVVGDNEERSADSRHFGAIDNSLILGKMLTHIKK